MAEKVADQACSVCLEQFVQPKILPCCHTFCLKCLEKTLKEGQEEGEGKWEEEEVGKREQEEKEKVGKGEKEEEEEQEEEEEAGEWEVTCPQCHKTHAIPIGGLQGFVTDFVVINEIEVSRLKALKSSLAKNTPLCGECEGEGPVESYCCDCQAYLCSECSNQAHKKFRSYCGHKVIPVQDLDAASLQSSKVHYCSAHKNEIVKLYCETCSKLVCRECYLVDHHRHSCKKVQDARKQLGDLLTSLVEDGKQKLAAFKVNLGEIQWVETSAANYPEIVKAKINAFFDGVIQSTEERRHQLLSQADALCDKDLKLIWADKVFHQATISEAEDALRLADKARKCTSDVEMISVALLSIRQLSRLQAIQWDASTLSRIVPSPVDFIEGTELKTDKVGGIARKEAGDNVIIQNLPKMVALGKTVTFRIVPTLVDGRSQERINLIKKAKVIVKYGHSKKSLNTVSISLSPEYDGSYNVSMRLICGGLHQVEVMYEDKPVKGSPFSLEVTEKPEKGARVKTGPDWMDSNLQVQEGVVQNVGVNRQFYQSTTTVNICWDDVNGVHQYTWERHQIELV